MKLSLISAILASVCAVSSSPLPSHDVEVLSAVARDAPAKRTAYKDMLLYDLYTRSVPLSNSRTNTSINFIWTDPNSNTTAVCSQSWLNSSTTSSQPTSYVECKHSNTNEWFQFYFSKYTSMSAFTLQLDHEYQDATNFPPPWDYPSFFSTETLNLTCTGAVTKCCRAETNPIHAMINAMSD